VHFPSVSLKCNSLQEYGNNHTVYAPYHVTFTNNTAASYQQHGRISSTTWQHFTNTFRSAASLSDWV